MQWSTSGLLASSSSALHCSSLMFVKTLSSKLGSDTMASSSPVCTFITMAAAFREPPIACWRNSPGFPPLVVHLVALRFQLLVLVVRHLPHVAQDVGEERLAAVAPDRLHYH